MPGAGIPGWTGSSASERAVGEGTPGELSLDLRVGRGITGSDTPEGGPSARPAQPRAKACGVASRGEPHGGRNRAGGAVNQLAATREGSWNSAVPMPRSADVMRRRVASCSRAPARLWRGTGGSSGPTPLFLQTALTVRRGRDEPPPTRPRHFFRPDASRAPHALALDLACARLRRAHHGGRDAGLHRVASRAGYCPGKGGGAGEGPARRQTFARGCPATTPDGSRIPDEGEGRQRFPHGCPAKGRGPGGGQGRRATGGRCSHSVKLRGPASPNAGCSHSGRRGPRLRPFSASRASPRSRARYGGPRP